MKGKYFLFIALLYPFFNVSAQPNPSNKNTLFLELGGLAPDYSLNFRREISPLGSLRAGVRMGIGITNTTYAFPFGIEFITPQSPHHLQGVLGFTPFIVDYSRISGNNRIDTDTFVDFIPGLGYRYEPDIRKWFGYILIVPKLRLDPAPGDVLGVEPEFRLALGFGFGLYL
ncbi:MAG: hypothetical protein AAF694_02910 [Bacteroidota bacterium]